MHKSVEISIQPDVRLHKVNRYLYSHFAEHLGRCVYGGIWVGEDSSIENDGGIRLDTVAALKRLALPALRWPGGCFADHYHWMDGIGPRERRPLLVRLEGWLTHRAGYTFHRSSPGNRTGSTPIDWAHRWWCAADLIIDCRLFRVNRDID